jgi:hypothetical protein
LAVSKDVGESGWFTDLGFAVLDCQRCAMSKFGYPNDEGRPEHPLYNGMTQAKTSVLEVVDSPWADEVSNQMRESDRRIWGGRGMEPAWDRGGALRHFIITLKEKTFECLARTIVVERYCKTFDEAFSFVLDKFKEH